jgi:flagellar basal-body rod modification protein FlgD
MAIDPTKASSVGAPPPAPVNPTSQMGKADFMRLLVAQLKNQDPLNPMDSREMIAQLATLTSVEKLTSLDTNMMQMRAESAGMASMQATALIGKNVVADSNHLTLTGKDPAQAQFELSAPAQSVTVSVRDSAGNTIRTLELGPQQVGARSFTWDGMDASGQRAQAGRYAFEVSARTEAGQPVAASTRVAGVVSEVAFDGGTAELVIGGARISLGDVVAVQP